MNIESINLVYFSPTGTTKKVLQAIAQGIGNKNVKLTDITKPGNREKVLQPSENELLIVGVPVYMGRVPALIGDWLNQIKANKTPVVCVAVYGNREFEDALLELKNTCLQRGCVPIAGAAFIGEHSFSSTELPTAANRPDIDDIKKAEVFGKNIAQKLELFPTGQIPELNVPGNYPYGGITQLWDVDFLDVSEECKQCGICASSCPTGAINPENSSSIDIKKCITCCACIKICPQNARSMKDSRLKDTAIRLNKNFGGKARKEPEVFYA